MTVTGTQLAPRITSAVRAGDSEGRRQVLRALLTRPVLRAQTDGELFRLARRHAEELRDWFDRETGWRLVVEPQSVRLLISYVPVGPTATHVAAHHPARARPGDPPLTRRRYVLLCLALAALERSDPQINLGRLAEEVRLFAQQPGLADIEFTLATREERSDLVAAIRLLLGYGVLVRVAGDEESYLAAPSGDVLYDVDRRVLATMLAAPHAPGLVDRSLDGTAEIAEIEDRLHQQPQTYTVDEANRQLRHAVSRRLLCDPVVYYDELPDAERDYLVGQRVGLTRRLTEATGLVAELRAEGIALVDPDDQLSDLRMPEQGTDGHATLLLAEHLAAAGPTDIAALRRLIRQLAKQNRSYWRRATQEPGAEHALVDAALDRLVGLGLVRLVPDAGSSDRSTDGEVVVHPLPALRRFAMSAPTVRETRRR